MEHKHKCCNKQEVKKGSWSTEEDEILSNYVNNHDDIHWRSIPELTGLKRCGKSCRLRWLNYLRPDLKHGDLSEEEANIVFTVHETLGNKWAEIARALPGRTDNEIKNFWNKSQKKKNKKKKSLSQNNNLPTSVAINPIHIPILESSHHSTTFNIPSANIDSSQTLLYNTTITNLNQPPPLKQPQEVFYNGHNLPPLPESISLPKHPTDHNQMIMSPLLNTSSIPNNGWMNPSLSYDNGYLPFDTSSVHGQPVFNTSLMPASGLVASYPSYVHNTSSNPTPLNDHNELMCPMINTSSIPLSGSMNPISKNASPPVNHMASTSVSATGNAQTNTSHGPKDVFDINEFFNFDQFCTTRDRALSSEEEGQEESQNDGMPTNRH